MPDRHRRARASLPLAVLSLLATVLSSETAAQGARSSASAQISLRAVVPMICSVRSQSGTITLTGTTDTGEHVDHGGHDYPVTGQTALSVICNTPYALGVERRLRRIESHQLRDRNGRPRVDGPAVAPIETATGETGARPLNYATLDLGVALYVSGNGAVHESHCVLSPPAGPVNAALLPAGAPCGVRSSLDDTSRPLARADARLIITGSLGATAPAAPFATSHFPESGTRLADLAPLPTLPGAPPVVSDALRPALPLAPVEARPVYELDHLSFSVSAKF